MLTDFGVCKVLSGAATVVGLTINSITGKTVAYSSPEILLQRDKHAFIPNDKSMKRDVYAGAIVMNELLSR